MAEEQVSVANNTSTGGEELQAHVREASSARREAHGSSWLLSFSPVLLFLLLYVGAWVGIVPRGTVEKIRVYLALLAQ